MSDRRRDSTDCSRRGFLASACAGLALGTGHVTARPARLAGTAVVEADADATRLGRALAADLASERDDFEATVRRPAPERQPVGGDGDSAVVWIAARSGLSGPEASSDDASRQYDLPLDVARFVPSRTEWYPTRSAAQLRGQTRPEDIETWTETDGFKTPVRVVPELDRVRPTRPPGSAATVLAYGTRAFQYASGFGGRGYYEVDGERLRSLTSDAERSARETVTLARIARLTTNGTAVGRLGADAVERVLSRHGAVSADGP